jgi:hypothetical protein
VGKIEKNKKIIRKEKIPLKNIFKKKNTAESTGSILGQAPKLAPICCIEESQ